MKAIYTKLLKFQADVEAVKKDSKNSHFKSSYFDINTLLAEVLPKLQLHGLILIQPISSTEAGMLLTTIVADAESGEEIRCSMLLPPAGKPQDYGAAITYYRRYSIQSLLGLVAEDDDGNSASGRGSFESAEPAIKTGGWKK